MTWTKLIPGVVSMAVSILIVLTKNLHGKHTIDHHHGVQKFHTSPTPRIGGVALALGLLTAWLLTPSSQSQLFGKMLIAGIPAFAAGLAEDMTRKIGVRARLIATIVSAATAWWLTGYLITRIDIGLVDPIFSYLPISLVFTLFAVSGVVNSINIIDGFNGLASGTLMICFAAFSLIAASAGDLQLVELCLIMDVVLAGFFVVNYPLGKIFMGDGGAYLMGFLLAWIAVMLPIRNPHVSVWAPLLVCSYPVIETTFSMFRRLLNKQNAGHPDGGHMHSLIKVNIVNRHASHFPQNVRNSLVSPLCWLYALLPCSLAVVFHSQEVILIISLLFSIVLYVAIYFFVLRKEYSQAPPKA